MVISTPSASSSSKKADAQGSSGPDFSTVVAPPAPPPPKSYGALDLTESRQNSARSSEEQRIARRAAQQRFAEDEEADKKREYGDDDGYDLWPLLGVSRSLQSVGGAGLVAGVRHRVAGFRHHLLRNSGRALAEEEMVRKAAQEKAARGKGRGVLRKKVLLMKRRAKIQEQKEFRRLNLRKLRWGKSLDLPEKGPDLEWERSPAASPQGLR